MSNELKQMYKKVEQAPVIPIDTWNPASPEEEIFREVKGALYLPVSAFYGIEDNPQFDYFVLTTKRCYNADDMRSHMTRYMNYFEKYYDPEHKLLLAYFNFKYLIDYEKSYNEEALAYDIKRYILTGDVGMKISMMNRDNYNLDLSYRNNKNPGLQYTNKHGMILMELSVFQNMIIPILTHFIFVKKVKAIKFFLLKMFQLIIDKYDSVDIINKLYETTLSTVTKNAEAHSKLWKMQPIRAKSVTSHSIQTVTNILLQISPKYTYDKNIIHFNYKSIIKSMSYQVIDIGYEYKLKGLSSSSRDEDNNSEFDKYEAHLIKHDEALYIQNKVNAETSMKQIEIMFGPFSEDEIDFYEKELTRDKRPVIIEFQKTLVFNLFYKFFGDTRSINAINARSYIKLIIAAKRMLKANNMIILPEIISGKIIRLVNRVTVNRKDLIKIEASPYFPLIENKYRNAKISKYIFSIMATILSSKFQYIDYQSQKAYEYKIQNAPYSTPRLRAKWDAENFNGKNIEIMPDYICEEMLMYTLMI